MVDGKIAALAQLSGEGGVLGELVIVREDAADTSRGWLIYHVIIIY